MKKIIELIKKSIPSLFTSFVLLSGCISISYSSKGILSFAGYLIIIGAVFDFIDGFSARLLNSVSDFGKQLDSLADVICFGLAPAFILYQLMLRALVNVDDSFNIEIPNFDQIVILSLSFLVALFAAFRLAKFNIDPDQKSEFKGLPTPAAALLIVGLGELAENYSLNFIMGIGDLTKDNQITLIQNILTNVYVIIGIILLISFLMISNIRMFSLKFKNASLKDNAIQYIFILTSIALLIILKIPGLIAIISLYILFSVFISLLKKKQAI